MGRTTAAPFTAAYPPTSVSSITVACSNQNTWMQRCTAIAQCQRSDSWRWQTSSLQPHLFSEHCGVVCAFRAWLGTGNGILHCCLDRFWFSGPRLYAPPNHPARSLFSGFTAIFQDRRLPHAGTCCIRHILSTPIKISIIFRPADAWVVTLPGGETVHTWDQIIVVNVHRASFVALFICFVGITLGRSVDR